MNDRAAPLGPYRRPAIAQPVVVLRTASSTRRRRLLCVPHAGAGPAALRGFADVAPDDVEVCALLLPGRERAIREPALRTVEAAVMHVVPAVRTIADDELVMFGHSMGALIAFELCSELALHGIVLRRLVVSASRAPSIPERGDALDAYDADALISTLRTFGGIPDELVEARELLDLLMPTLRIDLRLSRLYERPAGLTVPVPILALGARHDPTVTLEDLASWRDHTRAGFTQHLFDGGHFYFRGREAAVLRSILDGAA